MYSSQVPKEEAAQTPERSDIPTIDEIPNVENPRIQEKEEVIEESETDDDLPADVDQLRTQKPPLVPQVLSTRTPTIWKELGPLHQRTNPDQKKRMKKSDENSSTLVASQNVDRISKIFQE